MPDLGGGMRELQRHEVEKREKKERHKAVDDL